MFEYLWDMWLVKHDSDTGDTDEGAESHEDVTEEVNNTLTTSTFQSETQYLSLVSSFVTREVVAINVNNCCTMKII